MLHELIHILDTLQIEVCKYDTEELDNKIIKFCTEIGKKEAPEIVKKDQAYIITVYTPNGCLTIHHSNTVGALIPEIKCFLPENMLERYQEILLLKEMLAKKRKNLADYIRFLGNICTTLADLYRISPVRLHTFLPDLDYSSLTLLPEDIEKAEKFVSEHHILQECLLENLLIKGI